MQMSEKGLAFLAGHEGYDPQKHLVTLGLPDIPGKSNQENPKKNVAFHRKIQRLR
jgi:hypothetical protein